MPQRSATSPHRPRGANSMTAMPISPSTRRYQEPKSASEADKILWQNQGHRVPRSHGYSLEEEAEYFSQASL